MISDLDIWRAATVFLKQFGKNADIEAARRVGDMASKGDGEGAVVWLRIQVALASLMKAVSNFDREHELYFQLRWPVEITEELVVAEMYRHAGRDDFGFDGIDDLPERGPLCHQAAGRLRAHLPQ